MRRRAHQAFPPHSSKHVKWEPNTTISLWGTYSLAYQLHLVLPDSNPHVYVPCVAALQGCHSTRDEAENRQYSSFGSSVPRLMVGVPLALPTPPPQSRPTRLRSTQDMHNCVGVWQGSRVTHYEAQRAPFWCCHRRRGKQCMCPPVGWKSHHTGISAYKIRIVSNVVGACG